MRILGRPVNSHSTYGLLVSQDPQDPGSTAIQGKRISQSFGHHQANLAFWSWYCCTWHKCLHRVSNTSKVCPFNFVGINFIIWGEVHSKRLHLDLVLTDFHWPHSLSLRGWPHSPRGPLFPLCQYSFYRSCLTVTLHFQSPRHQQLCESGSL